LKRALFHILIVILLVQIFVHGSSLDACTTFCLDDGESLVFGRNLDWSIGVGLVIVNKRGLSKMALIPPLDVPASWISRYGSVTFNQYGRELPMGGLNEKGLVVEQMWLQDTQYPERDDRPALNELAWIQYQLDNFMSVDEVIASDPDIRITPESAPLHFLICDRTGQTAVIEFLKGKMVVHKGEELPFKTLANSTYERSLAYLKSLDGFGGDNILSSDSPNSVDRFARAVRGTDQYRKKECGGVIDYAFEILKDVSQGKSTQWSIVYDVKGPAVHFKTGKSPKIKILNLKDIDFSCETPCRVLDIDSDGAGDVHARFVDYTTEINKKLIYDSWKNTSFLKDTPDTILDLLARHPESFEPAKKKGAKEAH